MSNVYYVHFTAVLHLNILYGINILNGKMGKPINAYLYENCRITYRKNYFLYDFRPMVKAST